LGNQGNEEKGGKMRIGYGNYCYKNYSHGSKIFFIKHGSLTSSKGIIDVGVISFPSHCIGKKVRLKIEFLEENDDEKTETEGEQNE
jgi:hypothetical protein